MGKSPCLQGVWGILDGFGNEREKLERSVEMGRRFGGNGLIGRFFLFLEERASGVRTR